VASTTPKLFTNRPPMERGIFQIRG